MAWAMQMNNNDHKCMIKAKMEINTKKKKQVRFANLKATRNMRVLTNVNLRLRSKSC